MKKVIVEVKEAIVVVHVRKEGAEGGAEQKEIEGGFLESCLLKVKPSLGLCETSRL